MARGTKLPIDFTVHSSNLRNRALRQSDFIRHPSLTSDVVKDKLIADAEGILENGFAGLKLIANKHNGKTTYRIDSFEHELVLRLVGRSIQSLTSVRQSNRVVIIKALKSLLSEGVDYRVYRLDLKSFFESVDVSDIVSRLRNDRAFSRQNLILLEEFFSYLSSIGITGLPRGVPLSAILSEYVLRDFDSEISSESQVFYYARFVDDIIIISRGLESAKQQLRTWASKLPSGLRFNLNKSDWFDLVSIKGAPQSLEEIEFLGYQFLVPSKPNSTQPQARAIETDISPRKRNKIKTRIVKSALTYCVDGNFSDFLDRIKLLSSNATVFDQSLGVKRKIGIYYNYQLIDVNSCVALGEIDEFYKRFLLSKSGPIASKLAAKLSDTQRRRLLKLSFERGFRERTFVHYRGARMAHLMRCWEHG